MRCALHAFLVAGLGGLLLWAPAARAQQAPHPELDAEELEFLRLINDYRRQSGLGELVATVTLNTAADRHSYDMASNDWFDHTGSDGSDPSERCAWAGYPEGCAENIAAGYPTASDVFAGWRSSWGHNANMLGDYQAIGIALEEGGGYGSYWTTDFGWTIDEPYDPNSDPGVDPGTDPAPDPDPEDPGTDPDPAPDPPDPGGDPDPGGRPPPLPDSWGGFGDQCRDGDECASRACVIVDETVGYCTRACDTDRCPYGYSCETGASGAFCFFAGDPSGAPPGAGPPAAAPGSVAMCAAGGPPTEPAALGALVLVAALALGRRRLRDG